MGNLAYLSLGSNVDADRNLPAAVARLAEHGRIRATSSVWETLPLGFMEQPHFLNAAVLLETTLSAVELRGCLLAGIEAALGRRRTANKNAPRPIDLDIMLFNRDVLDIDGRHIPDPEIYERAFVAITLAEIDPDYVHPETGETLRSIAARFDSAGSSMRLRPEVILAG